MADIPFASDDDDGGADPFGVSEDLVASPQHTQPSTKSINFDGLLSDPIRLHEDPKEGNGGLLWIAGMVLARYLLRRKTEELHKSSIVELGAGGGLCGLAVAAACRPVKTVQITDTPAMLDLMQRNIALNNLQDRVQSLEYSWGSERPASIPEHPDVVLAADCVYFEPAFPLLLQTLQDLVGPNTVCYFCFKRRRRADLHFLKSARKAFVVEDVSDDPDRSQYSHENVFLCTIRKKVKL